MKVKGIWKKWSETLVLNTYIHKDAHFWTYDQSADDHLAHPSYLRSAVTTLLDLHHPSSASQWSAPTLHGKDDCSLSFPHASDVPSLSCPAIHHTRCDIKQYNSNANLQCYGYSNLLAVQPPVILTCTTSLHHRFLSTLTYNINRPFSSLHYSLNGKYSSNKVKLTASMSAGRSLFLSSSSRIPFVCGSAGSGCSAWLVSAMLTTTIAYFSSVWKQITKWFNCLIHQHFQFCFKEAVKKCVKYMANQYCLSLRYGGGGQKQRFKKLYSTERSRKS